MKILSGFLVSCVFSGPTRPAGSDVDFECPTECVHLVTLKKLNRGPRPDYEECDIDQLAEKCQAESKMEDVKCPTECEELKEYENILFKGVRPDYDYGCDLDGLVEKCQNQKNGRVFPDYIYDLPEDDPDFDDLTLNKLNNEVCQQFPDVCCPLMVAEGAVQNNFFSDATLALLFDAKARETCNLGRNRACCVEGDLCNAFPDLPNCLTFDVPTTVTTSTAVPVAEEETTLEFLNPIYAKPGTTTEKTTTTTTEKASTTTTTTIAPSNAPIVADNNLGNGNGENEHRDEAENGEHNEKRGSANWWIVAALLLGIGALVLGVVVAKKVYSGRGGGYSEAHLIATQEKSSLDDGQDEQQHQQQQQQQQS